MRELRGVRPMRVGFTGTRRGMTDKQKYLVRRYLLYFDWMSTSVETYRAGLAEFHHGAAEGADREAAAIVEAMNRDADLRPILLPEIRIVPHPAGDDPLARNRDIVDAVDILLAAPAGMSEELRSGTWATIRYARKVSERRTFKLEVVWPR